jgi:hypothetical protein
MNRRVRGILSWAFVSFVIIGLEKPQPDTKVHEGKNKRPEIIFGPWTKFANLTVESWGRVMFGNDLLRVFRQRFRLR